MPYFEDVKDIFEDYQCRNSEEIYDLKLAGQNIRLKFICNTLQSYILPAFQHIISPLKLSSKNIDLTIFLANSRITGGQIPFPNEDNCKITSRGHITGLKEINVQAAYQRGVHALNLYDKKKKEALFCIDLSEGFPYYEKSSPLKFIFQWFFSDYGIQLLHAAAIGNKNGGVLITAKGGQGKSTTAVNGLLSGLNYISDDYCLCKLKSKPIAYSIYSTAKLSKETLGFFPALDEASYDHNWEKEEKRVFFVPDISPQKPCLSQPIRAILVPEISNRSQTFLEPLSPIQALRAMAPSSIFQIPHVHRKSFHEMRRIVSSVPTYKIKLGYKMDEVIKVINKLLKKRDLR